MTELTDEAKKAVEQIEKLLRLAAKNSNENEAAQATIKAQELLTKYNLDMATVEHNSGGKSRRADEKLQGGLYHFQRQIWRSVAQLNFCLYWNLYVSVVKEKKRKQFDGTMTTYTKRGWQFQHQVVGRVVNVQSTKVMAEYLEQVIERLTRERLHGDGSQFFTRWAISYREGMAARIVEKVEDRRRTLVAEDRKAREAKHAQQRAGTSTSTAITLSTYIDEETDANIDFLHGEGTAARWAAERAEAAARDKRRQEERTKWAAEHPEEAAKEEAARHKSRRRSSWNAGTAKDKTDWGAYYAGYDDAATVGIDPQTDSQKRERLT